MYRFFAEPSQIEDNRIKITGQDAHHIKNVLRMKCKEKLFVVCGDEWEYTCEISGFGDGEVIADIVDAQKPSKELPSKITLYQCLPKKDKMELIIQKAVELGVYRIVPVDSSRCIAKLEPKKSEAKLSRWNTIASSAAKQSKRMIEPEVSGLLSFKNAVQEASENDVFLIPYEREEGIQGTRQILEAIKPGQSVALIIGPEGGFDEAEVELAKSKGAEAITLGNRVLRTETAGIAALSVLMYLLEQ